jgi:FkbM family methyltransferase
MEEAAAHSCGDFGEIAWLSADGGSRFPVLLAAAECAAAEGFDWLLAVPAAETLAPDIFAKMAPALRIHDAVWGGAAIAAADGSAAKLERITRLAAQDLPAFFHAALRWWIGPSHFVRPAAALAALHAAGRSAPAGLCSADMSAPAELRSADMPAWYADYMLALWSGVRAYKTAQCLTHVHGVLPALGEAERARLVRSLEETPVFMILHEGGRALKLPYTGLNPVIEREQMRGLFFEEEELRFLAARLPRGLRILDVGANTGNHTLFFATVMAAATVTPIEPLPRAAVAIQAMVAENALTNVDLSSLGRAVGASEGRLRAVPSLTAGLGATHFVPDPAGDIPVQPLDALVDGRVDFMKIDVEGMEMQVLAGAAGLIAAQHPVLHVEVVDEGVAEFMAWADHNGYSVEKLFPDKTHCNYLLVPCRELERTPA